MGVMGVMIHNNTIKYDSQLWRVQIAYHDCFLWAGGECHYVIFTSQRLMDPQTPICLRFKSLAVRVKTLAMRVQSASGLHGSSQMGA